MTIGVIDNFETIDIQKASPLGFSRLFPGEGKISHSLKISTVEQPGQIIAVDLIRFHVEEENQQRNGETDPQHLDAIKQYLQKTCNGDRKGKHQQRTVDFSLQLVVMVQQIHRPEKQIQIVVDNREKEVRPPAVS